MRYVEQTSLNAVSAAASTTGPTIDSSNLINSSVMIVVTGTVTGIVKLQGSNDYGNSQSNSVPTNWVDIPNTAITLASANAFIPTTQMCYNWIRVAFVAGGTGTVTAKLFAQGM